MTLSRLRRKSDIHIERKRWHFIGVSIILICYNTLPRPMAVPVFSCFAVFFITGDILRLRFPGVNKVAMVFMAPFMRESERTQLAGTTYLMAAAWIIIFSFKDPVVNLSLGFLAVADPMASLIGVLYGKTKLISGKSLEGSLTAFACCFLISCGYFYFMEVEPVSHALILGLICGVVGALSELIPIGRIDDNFTLPIISALFLWTLFYFFPNYGM